MFCKTIALSISALETFPSTTENDNHILLNRLCSDLGITINPQDLQEFMDVSVSPRTLAVTLLPIVRHILHTEPEIIIGLSNGADLMLRKTRQLIERLHPDSNYQPEYLNIIMGRETPITTTIWMLLTEAERKQQLNVQQKNEVLEQAKLTTEQIRGLKIPFFRDDHYTQAIDELKTSLDLPVGQLILSLNNYFFRECYDSEFYCTVFPLLAQTLQPIIQNAKFVQQLQSKSILVLDEIVYSGRTVFDLFAILRIAGIENTRLGLLVRYLESRNEDHVDPIGDRGLNKHNIYVDIYGKLGRKSHWTVVNIPTGPDYDRSLEAISDGYGLQESMFATLLFDELQHTYSRAWPPEMKDNPRIKLLFSSNLRQVLYQTAIISKHPLPWKEEETNQQLKHSFGEKLETYSHIMRECLTNLIHSIASRSAEYTRTSAINKGGELFWSICVLRLQYLADYMHNADHGEELLYKNPIIRRIIKNYINSPHQDDDLAHRIQYLLHKALADTTVENRL